ncbi:hypothetical protein R1sor_012521 [Riccia sorocarpa]|uniref:Oxidoreductase-like domain-containing protein n=1 Tax=Riccia sorocarpa TaxID=122646 RepID=A0ABD3I401_9MARC
MQTVTFPASICAALGLLPGRYANPHSFRNSWSFISSIAVPGRVAEKKPDMFSIYAAKVKEVPETSAKVLANGQADAERSNKNEEQRKLDDAAEKVRREKEIEDKIGPPPDKPLPGDCCGNGCATCVWDTYWDELADYKKQRDGDHKKDKMYPAVRRTAVAAASGGGALLGLAILSNNIPSVFPNTPSVSAAPAVIIPDVRTAEVLEPHCGPLWECMRKDSGSCGLLEKQLRDCVARNKRS